MTKKPFVSVVIPTYNEQYYIKGCIDSLFKQSYKNFEIIIVDDGSTDRTLDIVSKYNVRIVKGVHKGPGFSRNIGAKKANGEVLVFVDADMTFDRDYLANLVGPLARDPKLVGTTHDYEEAVNIDNMWARFWGKIRVPRRKAYVERRTDMVIFRAIRRKVFLTLGGFDPIYGYADDQTFWLKHKLLPLVAKNTTCYHRNPQTLKEVYSQSRWIGASIKNPLFNIKLLSLVAPLVLIVVSPLAILFLSIRKSASTQSWKFLFPWMFVFIGIRYFGTVAGIARQIYFNKNAK